MTTTTTTKLGELGNKMTLGTYAKGSRVRLGVWNFKFDPSGRREPGDWVVVVGNYASTTGVVVVKNESNNATEEHDGRSSLCEVGVPHERIS